MRQRLQSGQGHFANFLRASLVLAFMAALTLPCFAFAGPSSQNEIGESEKKPETGVFRFHMPTEPHSLDPARLSSNDASYFFHNVMRGLYRHSRAKGLEPEGAKTCVFETPLRLRCDLANDSIWSDGKKVVAADYVRAFRHLVSPASKSLGAELLSRVKNVTSVYSGRSPAESAGFKAEGESRLIFEFESPDSEFLYKLASSLLVPIRDPSFPDRAKASEALFNGPYKVASWKVGSRIRLESNAFYKRGNPDRPPVEILFVDEDETALNLYERGTLSFLRRLPTHYIPKFKHRPDFLQLPVARFDYVGFGPDLAHQPELRGALSHSLKFEELAKIFDALGTPGCPGLPKSEFDGAPCIRFDLSKAKELFAKVPEEAKRKRYKFVYSRLAGDDAKTGAEWFQAQWRTHLGIKVDVEALEQGVYLERLRTSPPTLFRKGVGLDRPTCLAALETFARGGPENFIRLASESFERILLNLSKKNSKKDSGRPMGKLGESRNKDYLRACGEGLRFLSERNLIIPMGQIHFTVLARSSFSGWSLNELNQLDLAALRPERPTKKFQ